MYQNENLSVRASDEFMQAALDRQGMVDTHRRDRQAAARRRTPAKLLYKIAEGTHICGDPGMQFDGAIQKWHTCKGTEPIHSTNPCCEYRFPQQHRLQSRLAQPDEVQDARTASSTSNASRPPCASYITAQEILVDNASYPTKDIAENSHIFRTLGLGFANLGSLIMSYGIGYDSDEGRAPRRRDHLHHDRPRLRAVSAEIAADIGPFPGYRDARCAGVEKTVAKDNVESMLERHRAPPRGRAKKSIRAAEFGYLKDEARKTWDGALGQGHASTAIATRRSPSSRRPAPSASSWTATPPASSPTSRW